MRVRFGNGTKDVPLTEVTRENYIVPQGEENTYHCRIEQTQFHPRTGKRLSVPRIQKFDAKIFTSIQRTLKQQGWDVEILYDPTEFLKEQEAKIAEMKQLTYQQRKELEAARKKQEREAMKKEILAELKAEGLLNTGKTTEPKTGGSKKK